MKKYLGGECANNDSTMMYNYAVVMMYNYAVVSKGIKYSYRHKAGN